jgi:hypothetical protein
VNLLTGWIWYLSLELLNWLKIQLCYS